MSTEHDFAREALLEQIVNPHIEDDSPAAAALRANAQVHIGKMSKVARSINAQALRKIVKRASMRSHFGNVKGKPPRVPPNQMVEPGDLNASAAGPLMSGIEEGESEDASASALDLGDSKGSMSPSVASEQKTAGVEFDSAQSHLSASESPSISHTNSKDESTVGQQSRYSQGSPTKGGVSVNVKESPPIIDQYPGDHLHYSLQAMEKHAPNVKALAPTGDQKDIPEEVVEGTMEAGRKGKATAIFVFGP